MFLDDGRFAAAGKGFCEDEWDCRASDPITVHIWDPEAGGFEDATLTEDPTDIDEIAFASDGAILVTVSKDRSMFLWDVPNRAQLHRVKRPRYHSGFKSPIFSPNNKVLAAVSYYGNALALWDVPSEQWHLLKELHTPGSGIDAVAFSPDSNLIAASSVDGAWMWDVLTGNVLWRYEGACTFGTLSFSRDGTLETDCGQVDLACFRESTASEKELELDSPYKLCLQEDSEMGDEETTEEGYGEDFEEGFEEAMEEGYKEAREGEYREGFEEDHAGSSRQGYEEDTEGVTDAAKEAYTSHIPAPIDEQTLDGDRLDLASLRLSTAGAEQRLANPLNMFVEGPWVIQGAERVLLSLQTTKPNTLLPTMVPLQSLTRLVKFLILRFGRSKVTYRIGLAFYWICAVGLHLSWNPMHL